MCKSALVLTLFLMTSLAQVTRRLETTDDTDYCAWKRTKYPQFSEWIEESENLDRIELVIGSFLPSRLANAADRDNLLNESLKPAVDLALEDIRNHPCVLKGYTLKTDVKDTECNTSFGTKAFFDMMNTSPRKVAIFGDACTNVNEPIAMMTKYWKIIQVSYAETHPKFSGADSKTIWPTFYRMVPAELNLNNARYRFLSLFNWTRVGTIKQSDEPRYALYPAAPSAMECVKWFRPPKSDVQMSLFGAETFIAQGAIQPHETFTTSLGPKLEITVTSAELTSDKLAIETALDKLQKNDSRIIIGDFSVAVAKNVFCEAYKRKLYGQNYVWIIPGYHNDTWWHLNKSDMTAHGTKCTNREFQDAINGHFIMEFVQERTDLKVEGINGKNVIDYLVSYKRACDRRLRCRVGASVWNAYAYDGIWTLAVALDQVVAEYTETSGGHRLKPGDVNATWFQNAFLQALNRTSFEGMTGKVRFDSNQRLGKIRIAQFQNDSYVNVGEYDGAEDTFNLYYDALFGWKPPRDKRRVLHQRQFINSVLYFVMCVLSSVGLVLAVVFLALNVRFRNHKYIRMSSPNMNNMIIVGSMLTYSSVMILGLDTRISFVTEDGFATLCYVKVWVLCFGFTLAFGSLFSKTWRVHSIFTNIKLNKKAIKDYKLFLIVGVLLMLDAVILGCWAIVAPMSIKVKKLDDQMTTEADDTYIIPTIELCQSDSEYVFQGVLYGYKGLLLVLGCFLAWETRHVNVPALNDSKYIGMAVYNVVLMCVLGVSLSFVLAKRKNESFCLTAIFIIFCTTLTLCLVFVPKVVELVKNPKGNERRYRPGIMKSGMLGAGAHGALEKQGSSPDMGDENERLMRLEQDNQVWHQFLAEKVAELADVIALLREQGEDEPSAVSQGKDSAFEYSTCVTDLGGHGPSFGGVYIGPADVDAVAQIKDTTVNIAYCSPTSSSQSGVMLPKMEDATETTSLLPRETSEVVEPKHPQLFQRIRSSLRSKASASSDGDQPRTRRLFTQSTSLDEAPRKQQLQRQKSVDYTTMQDGATHSSMPNLGMKIHAHDFPITCNEAAILTSDSTLTENSQGVIPCGANGLEAFDPVIPPGGGRMRYIDSILSEDILLSNSRTLQSITENAGFVQPRAPKLKSVHPNSTRSSWATARSDTTDNESYYTALNSLRNSAIFTSSESSDLFLDFSSNSSSSTSPFPTSDFVEPASYSNFAFVSSPDTQRSGLEPPPAQNTRNISTVSTGLLFSAMLDAAQKHKELLHRTPPGSDALKKKSFHIFPREKLIGSEESADDAGPSKDTTTTGQQTQPLTERERRMDEMHTRNSLRRRWARGEHCGFLSGTTDFKNFLKFGGGDERY